MKPSKRQINSVARYCSDIAEEYGLRDWEIVFHIGGLDNEDAIAQVRCIYGRKIAHVGLSEGWFEATPEEQRETLIHEFTHIHLDAWLTLIDKTVPEFMGQPAWAAFQEGMRQAMEMGVDGIAAAVARNYPIWEG